MAGSEREQRQCLQRVYLEPDHARPQQSCEHTAVRLLCSAFCGLEDVKESQIGSRELESE